MPESKSSSSMVYKLIFKWFGQARWGEVLSYAVVTTALMMLFVVAKDAGEASSASSLRRAKFFREQCTLIRLGTPNCYRCTGETFERCPDIAPENNPPEPWEAVQP